MRNLRVLMPVAAVLAAGASQSAGAAEVTRVATSFEEDNKFDVHFGVAYGFDFKKAAVLREWSDGTNNRLAKDLLYQHKRQTVTASVEIGLYHDLSIFAELPVVVSDNRNFSFDQEADNCVFPDDLASLGESSATCVDKTNSSTIRDAIIPRDGFSALSTSDPYNQFTGEETQRIFDGPTRRGIDQIHVGIKKGILNQNKLTHMPNWVIALEGRFAVGTPMQFTRNIALDDPKTNHTVGRGIHELGAWTSLSRRYRFLEPFFGAWWRQSLRAGESSQFKKYPFSDKANPMSQTGVYFGAEIVPWERKAKKQKVALNVTGTATLKYGGRAYSEVWELLADSPALVGVNEPGQEQCSQQAAVDFARANPSDPTGYIQAANDAPNSGGCKRFNGITNVQDFAIFGLDTALNFHLGQYARLLLGARMQTETRHFLTNANRGEPGRAGDPDRVDENTDDVNPLRRDVVDNVGRRYALDDVFNIVGYANFMLTF
jgi:hypothetical protein